jgi:hypothetical protein
VGSIPPAGTILVLSAPARAGFATATLSGKARILNESRVWKIQRTLTFASRLLRYLN